MAPLASVTAPPGAPDQSGALDRPVLPDVLHVKGKVAVVTGATGGMGGVIAVELARAGAHVITIARTPERAHALRERIARHASAGTLEVVPGDLTRREDVLQAAGTIAGRHHQVHLLVNNAGAHFPDRRLSHNGIEMHIALDYLAAYGLMTLLSEPLQRGRARIVNVVSESLNDTRQVKLLGSARPATLDLTGVTDLRQLNPAAGFVPFHAYARAKLMTVTAGYALAPDFAADGVTVNALHPGIVATDIIDDLVPPLLHPFTGIIRSRMLTPAQGASTAVRVATEPALAGVTARYFDRDAVSSTPTVSHDPVIQQQLRALSDAYFNS